MATDLIDAIDTLLPQTQCAQCGYPGCRPYAEAIACGDSDINRCAPGGAEGIGRLAALLDRPALPLDPRYGTERPRLAAWIREEWCIGCTLCIQACPTDAIVGAPKQMHTVLIAACTGCELCVPPCPVDCIEIMPMAELAARGSETAAREAPLPVAARASLWRERWERRNRRLLRMREQRGAPLTAGEDASVKPACEPTSDAQERRRQAIQAALERARARRAQRDTVTHEPR